MVMAVLTVADIPMMKIIKTLTLVELNASFVTKRISLLLRLNAEKFT